MIITICLFERNRFEPDHVYEPETARVDGFSLSDGDNVWSVLMANFYDISSKKENFS